MHLPLPPGDFGAYLFDCDGTLADNMPVHYQAWCAALAEHGCDFPEAMFYELGGTPTQQIVEVLNKRNGCHMPPEETARHKERLYLEMATHIGPIEAVVEIVHRMHGRLPMAVASGGHRRIVLQTLDTIGLGGKFDAVIGSEDYVNGKPAPDPFLTAARALGVEPARCLVFEDTQLGISAARAAGMQWVLVPPPIRG